jgi:hypothetical protein
VTTLSREAAAGNGYWFDRAGVFTMIWQKSGGVEAWSANPGGGGFKIVWNGNCHGSATKLFP